MTVKFGADEYDDDMTIGELAAKLGEKRGFVITANSLKRLPKLETYKPKEPSQMTAQEVLDSC